MLLAMLCIQPAAIRVYELTESGLNRLQPGWDVLSQGHSPEIDMNKDGIPEQIVTGETCASIEQNNAVLWQSPAEWMIVQAVASDLNRDGNPEVAMLVHRPYQPLPIDGYLPYPAPPESFRNQTGLTGHIVLIGYERGRMREVWAGSALARFPIGMHISDLNGDGFQELITIEVDPFSQNWHRQTVSIWTWQGFNFTLLDRLMFHGMQQSAMLETAGSDLLLLSGWEE